VSRSSFPSPNPPASAFNTFASVYFSRVVTTVTGASSSRGSAVGTMTVTRSMSARGTPSIASSTPSFCVATQSRKSLAAGLSHNFDTFTDTNAKASVGTASSAGSAARPGTGCASVGEATARRTAAARSNRGTVQTPGKDVKGPERTGGSYPHGRTIRNK
jgi:hypothetical protein